MVPETLVLNPGPPLYFAKTEYIPAAGTTPLYTAFPVPSSGSVTLPPLGSAKVTLPVGTTFPEAGVTTAVSVIGSPAFRFVLGFGVSVVVVPTSVGDTRFDSTEVLMLAP